MPGRSVPELVVAFLVVVGAPSFLGPGAVGAPPAPASPTAPSTARPTVAVTIPPQKWIVDRLAGGLVDVVVVVEPNANHETYQPTDRQASDVMRARAYFAVGLPLERSRWFDAVRGRLRVVDCTVGVERRELEGHGHDHDHDHGKEGAAADGHVCSVDGRDPHIWTSPAALRVQARTMAAALAELAPASADTIRQRLAALERELDALDASLRTTLAPCRGKALFVFHPAWGYFADAYGLRQVAIEHDGKPPTDRELTELQRTARAEGVSVVFVQPQISSKAADAVAAAVGGRVEKIDPLAEDVPANLRRVAEAIAKDCAPPDGGRR